MFNKTLQNWYVKWILNSLSKPIPSQFFLISRKHHCLFKFCTFYYFRPCFTSLKSLPLLLTLNKLCTSLNIQFKSHHVFPKSSWSLQLAIPLHPWVPTVVICQSLILGHKTRHQSLNLPELCSFCQTHAMHSQLVISPFALLYSSHLCTAPAPLQWL